MSDAID
jgi:hypothetical protein